MIEKEFGVSNAFRARWSGTNLTVLGAALTGTSVVFGAKPLAQATVVLGLFLISGSFIGRRLIMAMSSTSARIVVASSVGLLVVLFVGACTSVVLPFLGISRPLSRAPQVSVWLVSLLFIGVQCWRREIDPLRETFRTVRWRHTAWLAVLAVPPILSLVGATFINQAKSSVLSVVCSALVVAMVLAAVVFKNRAWLPPRIALLGSAMLTGAWQLPMRGGWLAGWDIQHEWSVGSLAIHQATFPLAQAAGTFKDPYQGMLSLTVWPAQIHSLSGLSLRVLLTTVPSLFLVLCLMAIWCAVRQWIGERGAAIICALLVVGSEPLLRELPLVTRQCYALFFFAVLIFALSAKDIPIATARVLTVIGGVGIAVTHYSSAYIAAGAVATGWLLSILLRTPTSSRVLSHRVSAIVVGTTILWGSVVAQTGSSIGQVWSSIQAEGFRFLPSSGSIITRWLSGASISKTVNANVLYQNDLQTRLTRFSWMSVDPRAFEVHLLNGAIPSSSGVSVVGVFVRLSEVILAELIVVGAVAATGACLWWCRRAPQLVAVAGVALFALGASLLSRLSQTVAIDFGPSRVQAQTYLVFAVILAIAASRWIPLLLRRSHSVRRLNPSIRIASLVFVGLAALSSTQLVNLLEHKAPIPATFSNRGEQIQRISTPNDVAAARWLSANRSAPNFVQSDLFGQLALFNYGFAVRIGFINSIDPVIVDDKSWIFASHTNLVTGLARGGDNASIGVYKFPTDYYARTRPVLYASGTDVIFGSDPNFLAQSPGGSLTP